MPGARYFIFYPDPTTSKNMANQSGNGIINASRLEDFKVFLNDDIYTVIPKADAKQMVIKSWEKHLLDEPLVLDKIQEYAIRTENYDFTVNSELDFLEEFDHWYEEIFSKNIDQQ